MSARNTYLAGHGLGDEGQPYSSLTCGCGFMSPPYRNRFGRRGHGVCECGAMSPCVTTNAARKRWHREHKNAVRSRQAAAATT